MTIADHAPLYFQVTGGQGREEFTATLANGNSVTFPSGGVTFFVDLNRAAAHTVTLDYATADGSATAGTDYTAKSGTLTFAPGETRKLVRVATGSAGT